MKIRLIILDIICWAITLVIMIAWRLITTRGEIALYALEYIAMASIIAFFGIIVGKYKPFKHRRFLYIMISTIAAWALSISTFIILDKVFVIASSRMVSITGFFIFCALNIIYILSLYFWRYAQYMDMDMYDSTSPNYNTTPQVPTLSHSTRPDNEIIAIDDSISQYTNSDVLNFLKLNTNLYTTDTHIVANTNAFSIAKIPPLKYNNIINLKLLNDIRGINYHFCMVNQKLPLNGTFTCCFRPQRVIKQRILRRYPRGINYIIYSIFFISKRIFPKLFSTSRLYFDITGGKNRLLSITEVLGRLYYCGFEVSHEKFVGHMYYIIARRVAEPQPQSRAHRYGPLIKLSRIGKNGKKFNVYKLRTMHPYSEFLQKYVFDKYGLQDGGKIADDMRVSTLGAFMRKYWIDELPMFINLFKGDMKFVGVRPLSAHYFSLYSEELQSKRTKFKPGLFPPFYADMPHSLEEIQASEMRYLNMCERRGCFITDIIYLYRIFINIVFKKARSK